MATSFVYAVHCPNKNELKIGYSTEPTKRLTQLQTGTTDRLDLLFTFIGGVVEEKALHKLFENRRVSGEWFTYDNYVLTELFKFAIGQLPSPTDRAEQLQIIEKREAFLLAISAFTNLATTKPRKNIPVKYLMSHSGLSRADVYSYTEELGYEKIELSRTAHICKSS